MNSYNVTRTLVTILFFSCACSSQKKPTMPVSKVVENNEEIVKRDQYDQLVESLGKVNKGEIRLMGTLIKNPEDRLAIVVDSVTSLGSTLAGGIPAMGDTIQISKLPELKTGSTILGDVLLNPENKALGRITQFKIVNEK